MREATKQVRRFAPRFGWANRILRLDLSNRSIEVEPVDAYVPEFLGGAGYCRTDRMERIS